MKQAINTELRWRVALSGGNVAVGANAGFAALNANNTSSEISQYEQLVEKSYIYIIKPINIKYMILTKTVKYRGKDKAISELSPNSNYKVEVQCPQCGEIRTVFYKSVVKAGHHFCQKCSAKNATRKYLEIGSKYNKLTIIGHSKKSGYSKVKCECGRQKEVGNYELTTGKTKSCGCIQKQTNVTPVFYSEAHPNWKGGISSDRNQHTSRKSHRQWKALVLKRDDYKCLKCKSDKDLCAHHIIPFEESEELRCEVSNGATLCRRCHNTFHAKYGRKGNTKQQLDEFLNT